MGKRRKASARVSGEAAERDPSHVKLRISSYEDVADAEDEFHINRDKILLEDGPGRKRQRRIEEGGIKSVP